MDRPSSATKGLHRPVAQHETDGSGRRSSSRQQRVITPSSTEPPTTYNPIRWGIRKFLQWGKEEATHMVTNMASAVPSEVDQLFEELKELVQQDTFEVEAARDIIAELRQKQLTPKQAQTIKLIESSLNAQSGSPTAILDLLRDSYDANRDNIGSLVQKGIAWWKGGKEDGAEEADGNGWMGALKGMFMGAPPKVLAVAVDALENFKTNEAVGAALDAIVGGDDNAHEKAALKGKTFAEPEKQAIATLRDLAGQSAVVTPEQMAPVLKMLKEKCDAMAAEGVFPKAIQWTAKEAPAHVKAFWAGHVVPQCMALGSDFLGPCDRETELVRFVDEFCRKGFEAPKPPKTKRQTLENERRAFVTRTVEFVLKDYGKFSQFLLMPWVYWYVNGFEHNAFQMIEPLIAAHASGSDDEERQMEMYDQLQLKMLKHLKIYAEERFGKDGIATPEGLIADMTSWMVDQFAPRFHARKKIADFFGKWPVIFAPVSWVFQAVGFVSDTVCNGAVVPILKWALVRNKLIPTLLAESTKAMGLGTAHPHGYTKILGERLRDGLELLNKGGDPKPIMHNDTLESGLREVFGPLLKVLSSKAAPGPEAAVINAVAAKKIENSAVQQLCGFLHFVFTRDNLQKQVHNAYELLTESYDPKPAVSRAQKQQQEEEVGLLQDKMVFLGAFLAIEEEMDKPASLRRTAARFLETLRREAVKKGDALTEADIQAVSAMFLNTHLHAGLDKAAQEIFTKTVQTLGQMVQRLKETSNAVAQDQLTAEAAAQELLAVQALETFYKAVQQDPAAAPLDMPAGLTDQDLSGELQALRARGVPVEEADDVPADAEQQDPSTEEMRQALIQKATTALEALALRRQAAETQQKDLSEPAALHLQAQLNAQQALQQWRTTFDPFKALEVKPFDPNSLVGVATRAAFHRFQPLTKAAFGIINKPDFLDGALEHLLIRPVLGK